MESVNNKQAENLRRLLRYENLKQAPFSKIVHIPEPTISNWLTGKHEISLKSAKKIHSKFPAYDLDFILGNSEYPNRQSEINAQTAKEFGVNQCVERLVMNRGFSVSSFGEFDPNAVDMDKWREDWPNVDRSGFEYFERLEDDNGRSVKLTAEQWGAFVDEVGGYIELRVNSMLERGAW